MLVSGRVLNGTHLAGGSNLMQMLLVNLRDLSFDIALFGYVWVGNIKTSVMGFEDSCHFHPGNDPI